MDDFNDPTVNLLKALIAGSNEMIDRQDVLGQRQLVSQEVLPKEGDWEVLERWGAKNLGKDEDLDDLFVNAELPSGWNKRPTDHSMWSELVDDRGLVRAMIFYKAAFYDRAAHFRTCKRFGVDSVYDQETSMLIKYVAKDYALNRVVFSGTPISYAKMPCDIGTKLMSVFSGQVSSDGYMVGSVKGDRFHYLARWERRGDDSAKFEKSRNLDGSIIEISKKEFYAQFHHEKPVYEVIAAHKSLALVEVQEFLDRLPKDDSVWGVEFDLPEVE